MRKTKNGSQLKKNDSNVSILNYLYYLCTIFVVPLVGHGFYLIILYKAK